MKKEEQRFKDWGKSAAVVQSNMFYY